MAKINNSTSLIINVLLIILGCALIGGMWAHQGVTMTFYKDAVLSPGFYFFLNPYVKIIYIIGLTILIGKEFLLKKPITAKIKINIFAVVLLIILVSAQFLLWQHAIVNFAT